MRQIATSRGARSMPMFCREMSTITRIPEIILRERSIARSLPAFGLALACFALGLVVLTVA